MKVFSTLKTMWTSTSAPKSPEALDISDISDPELFQPQFSSQREASDDDFGQEQLPPHFSEATEELVKLFGEMETEQERLVGVVVTIFAQQSFDENFRQVRPETVPGEKVSTYSLSLFAVGKLHEYLAGTQVPEGIWSQLVEDIRSVAADSVTFNWECCGACSDNGFCKARTSSRIALAVAAPTSPSIHFISFALQSGFSVMCSDFSLKALIAEWSEELLGPNPFIRLRTSCDSQFQLEFFPEQLKNDDVPQQLQVVGELCTREGKAVVSALSDTIVYTVNPHHVDTDAFQLKVLTVISNWTGGSMVEAMQCEIQHGELKKRGAAGHVALTYPSGGQLITSMGHWIELTRINTSVESIMQVAAKNFGQLEISKQQAALSSARTEADRQRCVQELSKQMIQKSVPSTMRGRTKY